MDLKVVARVPLSSKGNNFKNSRDFKGFRYVELSETSLGVYHLPKELKDAICCLEICEYADNEEVGIVSSSNGEMFNKLDPKFNERDNVHARFFIPDDAVEIVVKRRGMFFDVCVKHIFLEKRRDVVKVIIRSKMIIQVTENFEWLNVSVENYLPNNNVSDLLSELSKLDVLTKAISIAIRKCRHSNPMAINYY